MIRMRIELTDRHLRRPSNAEQSLRESQPPNPLLTQGAGVQSEVLEIPHRSTEDIPARPHRLSPRLVINPETNEDGRQPLFD
jgi:hypothetical protein